MNDGNIALIRMKQCLMNALSGFAVLCVSEAASQEIQVAGIPCPLRSENKAKLFTQNGSSLIITTGEKTDMFRDPNVTCNTGNAPQLLFNPDEDFVLTASVEHAFEKKWDGGAIVRKHGSGHMQTVYGDIFRYPL